MQRSDLVVFAGTFLFGLFTGVFIYYVGWQPNFSSDKFADTDSAGDLEIIAEQYGSCTSLPTGCATFRVTEDREYRLIYTNSEGSVLNSQEGKLSDTVWDYFVETWETKEKAGELNKYPTQTPDCVGNDDGMWYQVQVSGFGTLVLDDCDTRVSTNDQLYEAITDIAYSIGAF